MKTKENKNLLAVGIFLLVCFIALCFSTTIYGGQEYQVRPEISIPEHRTDTGRAMDAYERLMDRFMNMTERNLIGIDRDVRGISGQLASINSKLSEISTRIANIEKKLEAQRPVEPVKATPPVQTQKPTVKPVLKVKDQP